jgi:hypothetical protein
MLLGHGHSYLEGIDEEFTGHEGDGSAVAAARWREQSVHWFRWDGDRYAGCAAATFQGRSLQRPVAMWAMPCLQTPLELERCD